MHFANIQMGNFIWGRVYGLGKIGRGKVYDSLQEYSPLNRIPLTMPLEQACFWYTLQKTQGQKNSRFWPSAKNSRDFSPKTQGYEAQY